MTITTPNGTPKHERLRVDIWSDVVCPWCAIGKAHLDQALAEFAHADEVDVVWHSYELDPTAPAVRSGDYVGMLAKKYGTEPAQAQQMIDQMTERGAEVGVPFRFDRVQTGNTFDAHRVIHLVLWLRLMAINLHILISLTEIRPFARSISRTPMEWRN